LLFVFKKIRKYQIFARFNWNTSDFNKTHRNYSVVLHFCWNSASKKIIWLKTYKIYSFWYSILQKLSRFFQGFGNLKIPKFPKVAKILCQIGIIIFAKKNFWLGFLTELSVMCLECRALVQFFRNLESMVKVDKMCQILL
jgi:hypothetical protein